MHHLGLADLFGEMSEMDDMLCKEKLLKHFFGKFDEIAILTLGTSNVHDVKWIEN
jgi:hypothetical protein